MYAKQGRIHEWNLDNDNVVLQSCMESFNSHRSPAEAPAGVGWHASACWGHEVVEERQVITWMGQSCSPLSSIAGRLDYSTPGMSFRSLAGSMHAYYLSYYYLQENDPIVCTSLVP